ncbi:MAG: hypothetical protein U0T33_09440 [Bacteroidales bacterium]
MSRLTKREGVIKLRAAKVKALKKGKKLTNARTYSSKYEKIQKNNNELLRKLKAE